MQASPQPTTVPAFSPEILRIVGDVAQPTAPVPASRDLGHLPGETGLLAGMSAIVRMVRDGEVFFRRSVERYGPVFRGQLGPDPLVFVADPDLIWTIARNEDGAWSAPLAFINFYGGLGSSGPLLYDFEKHKDVRRLLQPAFGAPAISGYVTAAEDIFEREISRWLHRGRVDFKAEVRRLFARISARIFMGIDDPNEAAELDRAMNDGWQAVLALRRRTALSLSWRQAQRGIDALWRMMGRHKGSGSDLLSRLRETHGEAGWLDDEHTRLSLFIGIMFGAFDTTASGAASMAYLLAKHPEWQERLRREAAEVTADRPTPDDLKGMEQHDWVWKEALRLFPVASQVNRQTLREVQLGAFRIPAAAKVVGLTGTASRDPKWWTEPMRFDPERFSPGRAEDKRHKAIFLPFGAGAHACIGAQLAAVEVRAFWHAMLRRCRFRLERDYEARHGYRPIGIVSGDVRLTLEPVTA